MAIPGYIKCRKTGQSEVISGRPYLPNVNVSICDHSSVIFATLSVLFYEKNDSITRHNLVISTVTGGITNSLFRVSGLSSPPYKLSFDSVLVRVFGADGMIDRDVETATLAALADKGIAPAYLGRFGNGRIEGWLDNFVPLNLSDLQSEKTSKDIAVQLANLHFGFTVPQDLSKYHNENDPGMWKQMSNWMDQAKAISQYQSQKDDKRAKEMLDLEMVQNEVDWLRNNVISKNSNIVFAHNDLLPGNIMSHVSTGKIQLIDFEYGGINYAAFDIANHFNEYAGGASSEENGVPNYELFPSSDRQRIFITEYVESIRDASCKSQKFSLTKQEQIESLVKESQAFVLPNHLFWGLWGVNQAAVEGTEDFDYLIYAVNRFKRYFICKESYILSSKSL